jgi:hypothetical protein
VRRNRENKIGNGLRYLYARRTEAIQHGMPILITVQATGRCRYPHRRLGNAVPRFNQTGVSLAEALAILNRSSL